MSSGQASEAAVREAGDHGARNAGGDAGGSGAAGSAPPTAAAGSLAAQVEALGPWFHNLHLPGGVRTVPSHFLGGDFPRFKWLQIAPHIPEDLRGWRVLDVGCNAGFYTFELARRGARVTAVDVDAHYLRQAQWAAGVYGLDQQVEFHQMGVYDIARWKERFDLVWFMGVFYHLRYPLLALDLLAGRTQKLMVFQTLTMPGTTVYPDTTDHPIDQREPLLDEGWPKMAFIEHHFAGDPTNWWVPNHAACEAMLRSSGMKILARPADEIYVCEPGGTGRYWDGGGVMQSAAAAAGSPER